jgi:predicted outer membrane repeat protein
MSFFSWLASAIGHRRSAIGNGFCKPNAGGRKPPRFRPQLEALEDRWMPSTLTVTTNQDFVAGSLRAEITAANSGDNIQFAPSLSGQTIMLTNSELVINKNLTIQGPSAPNAPVTISGQLGPRVFEVDGAKTIVALSNLTLIDGGGLALNAASAGAFNGQGGAIWNGGTLTITNCSLNNNVNSADPNTNSNPADYGGAIYNAGTLSVQSCILDNNSAGQTGFDATATGQGGAIYNAGMLTVSNSTLDYNLVTGFPARGAGIANAYKASATITNSTLSGNSGALQGGAIYNQGTMTLSGCTVSGNFAVMSAYNYPPEGGGIYNGYDGILTILNSVVTGNSPDDVYNLGTFQRKGSKIGSVVKG